jgi:hypothetical protein
VPCPGFDPDRLAALDGRGRRALREALRSAFPSRSSLAELLDLLEKSPDDYPGVGVGSIIFEVVNEARSQGWLAKLVSEAVDANPGNDDLRIFVEAYLRDPLDSLDGNAGPPAVPAPPTRPAAGERPGVPRRHRQASTAHFDLDDVEKKIFDAVDSTATVLAFATRYEPDFYLKVLRERISYAVGGTCDKEPLWLSSFYQSPDDAVEELATYAPDLETAHVLCLVRVDDRGGGDGIPPAVEFWRLLAEAFGGGRAHRLILLFVCSPGVVLPDGVTVLPGPAFTRDDVRKWTSDAMGELVDAHQWPFDLRWAWRDLLCRQAVQTGGDGLDPRRLYLAMEKSLTVLADDRDAFRRKLEEIRNVNPPSC